MVIGLISAGQKGNNSVPNHKDRPSVRLGLSESVDLAEFIVEGVFNDSNFENLAMNYNSGTGYLSTNASGRQELNNYIKDVVYSQLDIVKV